MILDFRERLELGGGQRVFFSQKAGAARCRGVVAFSYTGQGLILW
jgi:hypothetical protein